MLFALSLKPGLFKNGTKLQAAGRWFAAQLIRFAEGAIRPLGGWTILDAAAQADVVVFSDSFTGSNGTALNSHTPSGPSPTAFTWVTGPASIGTAAFTIESNAVSCTSNDAVDTHQTSAQTVTPDYKVQLTVTFAVGNTSAVYLGVSARHSSGGAGGYWGRIKGDGTLELTEKAADGSTTQTATASAPTGFALATPYVLTLTCQGSTITLSYTATGTATCSLTSTTWTGRYAGVWGSPKRTALTAASGDSFTVTTLGTVNLSGAPRSILGWRGNDGSSSIGIGTNTKWYAHWLGSLYDITPSGFTTGTVSAVVGTGGDSWGDGDWGDGVWGGLGPSQVTFDPPAVWHQDNWGDYLVGCCSPNDGHLYYWDRSPSSIGVEMTGAPTGCTGLVVTPERFMVALAPGGAVRTVQWASQESLTDWTGLGAKATVLLTSDATIPTTGDTVTIGSQTYTFRTALTPTAGEVLINGSAANALTNLKRAVTLTGTAGTDYAAATPSNSLVTATTLTATTLVFEALSTGAAGNSISSTETSSHLSFPTVTLTGGVDVGTAGDFVLEGKGSIVAARRGKDETLIWTTNELHAMRYIGGTLIYAFSRMGEGCGLIAPGAVAQPDTKSIWMGMRGFFLYDGYVQPVQSEVSDYVFSDFNRTQAGKVTSYTRAQFGEVTWHYPSAASDENDRYVTLNYRENHWTVGELERTAGCDAGALEYPVAGASNGALYEHENGWSHLDTDGTTLTPTLEAGPVQLGDGDRILAVSQLVPDEQNPVGISGVNLGNVELSLYTSFYPGEDETLHGPFSIRALTDCRFSGRWVRPELTEVVEGDWRFGTLRLDGSPAGRR